MTVKLARLRQGQQEARQRRLGQGHRRGGRHAAITVKLNAKGRKLLKKARALKVVSTVTVKRGTRIPVTSGYKFNVRKNK